MSNLRQLDYRFRRDADDVEDYDLNVVSPVASGPSCWSRFTGALGRCRDWMKGRATLRVGAVVAFVLLLVIIIAVTTSLKGKGGDSAPNATGKVVGPMRSKLDYLAVTLDNGMDVVLISDPDADKAAAAVSVRVGSADDPLDYQGLAHFLEHMLFLGTEAHPGMDTFNQMMAKYSGSHNAYTSEEETNYFFDIIPDKLEEGLDIFSAFFVSPELKLEAAEHEIHAVNAEHEKNLLSDSWRYWQLLKNTADSPNASTGTSDQAIVHRSKLHHFGTGSLQTLNKFPEVRGNLSKFFNDYYWAQNMQGVIVGRESITELRTLAEKYYGQIPKSRQNGSPLPKEVFPKGRDNYSGFLANPMSFQVVRSVGASHSLNLAWVLPSYLDYYRFAPVDFVSYLLGHEGEGTPAHYLTKNGYVSAFSIGSGATMKDLDLIIAELTLTETGVANIPHIIAVIEYYVSFLLSQSDEKLKELFEEQHAMLDIKFQYGEKLTSIKLASDIAARMAKRGRALHRDAELEFTAKHPQSASGGNDAKSIPTDRYFDILDPPLLREWDANLVRMLLQQLSPDNLITTLFTPQTDPSSALAESCPWLLTPLDSTEPVYSTEYVTIKPPLSPMTEQAKSMIFKAFEAFDPANNPDGEWTPRLPTKNAFVPSHSRLQLPSCATEANSASPYFTNECATMTKQLVSRNEKQCTDTAPRVSRGDVITVSATVAPNATWLTGDSDAITESDWQLSDQSMKVPTDQSDLKPNPEWDDVTTIVQHYLVREAVVGSCLGDIISVYIPARCTSYAAANVTQSESDEIDLFQTERFVVVRIDKLGPTPTREIEPCSSTLTPILVRSDPYARVFVAPDTAHELPRAYVGFDIVMEEPQVDFNASTPDDVALDAVRKRSLKVLWSHVVTAAAATPAYYASLAGATITTSATSRGFRVEINGYTPTLGKVLEQVVVSAWSNINGLLSDSAFETGLTKALTALYQQRESLLYTQAFPLYNDIGTSLDGVTRDEMIHYLKTKRLLSDNTPGTPVTLQDLKQFMFERFSQHRSHITVLAQGAVLPLDAHLYANQLLTALSNIAHNFEPLEYSRSFWYIPRIPPIPNNGSPSASWTAPAPARLKHNRVADRSPIIRIPTFNPDDSNSFTLNAYQYATAPLRRREDGDFFLPHAPQIAWSVNMGDIAQKTPHELVQNPPASQLDVNVLKLEVIAQLITLEFKDRAFQVLRTDEQLGYVVSAGNVFSAGGVSSIYVLVQGSKVEHSSDYYDVRIENFIETFKTELEQMSDETFGKLKSTLLTVKQQKPLTLAASFDENWKQIIESKFIWHQRLYEAALIDSITKQDVMDFYDKYMMPSSADRKKLSFQMWRASALPAAGAPTPPNSHVIYTGTLSYSAVREHIHGVLGFYTNTTIYSSPEDSYWNKFVLLDE